MSRLKVLIIGGVNNAALALVQSLGRNGGHRVDVAGCKNVFNKAFYSKFISRRFRICDPVIDYNSCIDNLAAIAAAGSYDVIIPTDDMFALVATDSVLRNACAKSKILIEEKEKLIAAMDKANVVNLAKMVGCPVPPETITLDETTIANLDGIAHSITYPAVIKPRLSWSIVDRKLIQGGNIRYAINDAELKAMFIDAHEHLNYPIIQRKIVGKGWGIEILAIEGRIIAAFAHKRLREANPTGSYSSAVESIPLDDTYFGYVSDMVRLLNWNGVCMFEFKNDDNDQIPKLMEINARFWGSLPLAIRSGVDFPDLVIRMARGEKLSTRTDYEVGVKCRWIVEDFKHLIKVWLGRPRGWKGYYPKRVSTLFEVMKFSKYCSYNNERIDPLPGLLELIAEPIAKLRRALR